MSFCNASLPPAAAAPTAVTTFIEDATCPPEVLRFEEELTLENVGAFRDRVFTTLGRRPIHLCLDLSACEFVDTSGLASLVTVTRVARRVHVPILVVPAPHLRRVLAISGLIRFIPVAPFCPVDENSVA